METEHAPSGGERRDPLEMNLKFYDEMYRPDDSDNEPEQQTFGTDNLLGGDKGRLNVNKDLESASDSLEEEYTSQQEGRDKSSEQIENSKSESEDEKLVNQPKERPFSMIKIGENLISNTHNVNDLPEEVKDVLKKSDVKKVLRGLADENGNVFIEGKDKIYQITYVQVIPAKTDCFEKYKQMELQKLKETFNLQKLVLI